MPRILTARAVLLDMDGTLVDSTAVVERIWLEWAADHGVDDGAVLDVIHGRQGHESMAILLPDRDPSVNAEENAALLKLEAEQTDGVVAVRGAAELLEALGTTPHALVTSADVPLTVARMGAAGFEMPIVRVTAEDVSRSKPHPEGFLRAAELLGVEPADCIVFEDSETGIAAAHAAGMTVIGVGERAEGQGAAHVVRDLTAVHVRALRHGVELDLD
jgi:mannitol-1-/sugar-/sorbitol-6-phosphatase